MRGAFPTDPRKFVRKMCGGTRKCAEIVRNLCGGAPAQFAHIIGVGLPRMCVHKFRAFFRQNLSFSLRPSCTGKKCLKPNLHNQWSVRGRRVLKTRYKCELVEALLCIRCITNVAEGWVVGARRPTAFDKGAAQAFFKAYSSTPVSGAKLRPWLKIKSDQNSDHASLCFPKEKIRPWPKFLEGPFEVS